MDPLPENNIPTEAFVVNKAGDPFVLQPIVLDGIRDNELLVEVRYTGICHTDLVVQAGHMPLGFFPAVLGHEGAGIVRQLGKGLADSTLSVGDRVILGFCSCLECPACLDGRKGSCQSIAPINFIGTRGERPDQSSVTLGSQTGAKARGTFFGQSSFSRLAVVDARAVVKYDGPVDDLACLASLGCGYMTGAATVMNVLKPSKASSLAVIGLGAVGLCAVMAAKHEGVPAIVALDIVESRLQTARTLGATHAIDSTSHANVENAIRTVLAQGVDYIVDTTGSTVVLESGMRALAHGGTLAIVGTPRPEAMLSVAPFNMLTQCKSLIGVTGGYCDPQEFIPRLIDLFKAGEFPVDTLNKVFPPSKVEEAIADMKSGSVVKPVIAW